MERRLLASEKEGSIQTQRQLADKDYKIDMGKSKVISTEEVLFFIITMFLVCSDAACVLTLDG